MRNGFTLIEILISTVLIGLVFIALTRFSSVFFSGYEFSFNQGLAVDHAQRAMLTIERELREMRVGADGSYPLVTAEDYELVFYGDVNNDGSVDRVRYYVAGSDLMRQVFHFSGDLNNYACVGGCAICHQGTTLTIPESAWPAHAAHEGDYLGPCVPGGGESITGSASESVVASYVQLPKPLFHYYNEEWPIDATNNPLIAGERLLNTRMIEISFSVFIDMGTTHSEPFELSTFVHLRNLRDDI